eukprot:4692970-Alexandrium_andersonii.AAC.1
MRSWSSWHISRWSGASLDMSFRCMLVVCIRWVFGGGWRCGGAGRLHAFLVVFGGMRSVSQLAMPGSVRCMLPRSAVALGGASVVSAR